VVVLAGRIGCRSRQAAFGPSRLRAKSSWTTTSGLASSRESVEVANERRKPNRRWQSREIGGGSPKTQEHAKAILQETLCRRKTLWAGKAAVVDAMVVAAVLAPRINPGLRAARGATGSVRGRSSAPHAVENTAAGRHRLRADARSFLQRGGRNRADWTKAGVTRRQARAQPGLGRRKTVWRRSRTIDQHGFGRDEVARSGRRRASCAPGNRAIRECSGCESVAEVGEKHLPCPLEGSREANREQAWVARLGGPVSLTRAGSHRDA
jgi:hypothetical protein